MIPFKTVKVPAQDDPATVDQVRFLRENNKAAQLHHRSLVFAAAWEDGCDAGNLLEDGGEAPNVHFPAGIKVLKVGLCLYNDYGSDYSCTFTTKFFGSGSDVIEHDETFTCSDGLEWYEWEIDATQYGQTFATARQAPLGFEAAGDGVGDTFIYHFAVWGCIAEGDTDAAEMITDPVLFEVANNQDLRAPAAEHNAALAQPQFLGGWLYTGIGDQITRDATATPPESFRLYHLFDYADDQLSEDSGYSMEVTKRGTTSTGGNDFTAKLYHLESTDAQSVATEVYDYETTRHGVGDVEGESYSTGAGVESVIMGDLYTDGGSGDNSYLKGVAFFAQSLTPYSDDRKRSANRTACDSEYFDALPGETVDYETIQALGRAQFNAYFRRAGQTQAIMFREGKSFKLTNALADFWRFHAYVGTDLIWAVNRLARGTFRGIVCLAASASGAVDVEIQLATNLGGDTDTVGFTLAAGMNYKADAFEIACDDLAGNRLEQVEATIRDKTSTSTITIYAVWIGYIDITQTY